MRYTGNIKERVDKFLGNRSLSLVFIFIIGFILLGGTFAGWLWESDETSRTAVAFSVDEIAGGLSCSADGGGDITAGEVTLVPASCTNSKHVIRRVITTNFNAENSDGTTLSMWLNVDSLGSYLANNNDFKYTISTSDSCTEDVFTSGDFGNATEGSTLPLINEKEYLGTEGTYTYYLYMWLDKSETTIPPDDVESRTMSLSLGGSCTEIKYETAAPVLDPVGLIPVTIDNSGNVTTISEDDDNWYNYSEKKWANAILVTESSRSNYLNTTGTSVIKSDILAYYVWIPRYSYKMNSTSGADNEAEISILWNYNQEGYIAHPAFKFGDDYIDGFWVGKFETTGTGEKPTILNGVSPLVSQNISEQFTSSLLFANGSFDDTNRTIKFANSETYGLINTTDSHMMKNSEWGAVAYLSHSKYGTCTAGVCNEVRYNNYYKALSSSEGEVMTGCGAEDSEKIVESDICTLAYGSGISEYPQSTSGNITGVFDMAGGAWEYVMGNYKNTIGSYWGYTNLPPIKYYDVYTTESACTTETCGGHALTETKNWYGDHASFGSVNAPWIIRGGGYFNGADAGVWFFDRNIGISTNVYSWRSVLVPTQSYKVELNANGGYIFDESTDYVISVDYSTASKYVGINETYGDLPVPEYSGYRFIGWFTDIIGGTQVTSENQLVEMADHTLYARYSELMTVTLNLNDGDDWGELGDWNLTDNNASKEFILNETYGDLPVPMKTGYTFKGWYTEANGTGEEITSTSEISNLSNHMLYANWRLNVLTIKYDINGGSIDADAGGYTWTTDSDGVVYKNGSVYKNSATYGGTIGSDGLANYNNSSNLYITRAGYNASSGAEWICLSGCSTAGLTFDQNTEYNVSEFCDVESGDCTVVLGVNWTDNVAPTASLSVSSSGTTITASFSSVVEQGSGISEYQYLIQTSSTCPSTGYSSSANSSYTFTKSSTAKYYVCARIVDNAGNISSTYSGSAVVAVNTYLYNYGDANSSITGGWKITKALGSQHTAYSLGTLTYSSGAMVMTLAGSKDGFVATKNKVDLTYYSKIRFTTHLYNDDHNYPIYCGAMSKNSAASDYMSASTKAPYGVSQYVGNYTIDVNVSSLSGSYYVGCLAWLYDGGTLKVTTYTIQLIV